MCIICNLPIEHHRVADAFLSSFDVARREMKAAAKAMLKASKVAVIKEDRERYDRIHKRMVRDIRRWNRIEQERELSKDGTV